MKRPLPFLLILLPGLLLAAAPPPGSTAATKLAKQSQHLHETIDVLFLRRMKPEPLPVVLPNPFQVVTGLISDVHIDGVESPPSAGETGGPAAKPAEPPSDTDAEALAHYVGSLRIGGVIQLNEQLQITINQSLHKQGDLIFLDNKNSLIYLRIVRLTPTEVTLGFNEAVQTIRLLKY